MGNKNNKIIRSILVEIAKEINEVLSLEPMIALDGDETSLKEALIEVTEKLIVPEDDYLPKDWAPEAGKENETPPGITPKTQEVLEQLIRSKEKTQEPSKKGEAQKPSKKEKIKAMPKQKAKKAKVEKPSQRANLILDCITKEFFKIEDICTQANKKYISQGGKDNYKQTLHTFKVIASILVYAKVIVVEEGKCKLA